MTGEHWDTAGALVGEVLKALTDKQGQVDIRLKHVALDWKGTPLGLELNGTVTVSVHMHDLNEKEKQALREANLVAIKS
ncbi:MAG: hypothetical protein L3J95_02675 [Thermoplasmata archaeon]|jgi:hypothetical protein|nr:hypothetical protein [Thermoplasmata archaeon]MCI4359312.1 hypothetical protein [Thermoplasmata archaeon]